MKSLINIRPSFNEGFIELSLQLEESFTIPTILMNGTVTEVQEFIGFFDTFIKRESDAFNRQKLKDVGAAVEEDVRRTLNEEHRVEATKLRKEIDGLERRLRETVAEAATMKGQLEAVRSDGRAIEEDIRAHIEENWTTRLRDIKEEQDRMITFLKSELAAARDQARGLQDKLMARESVLKSSVRRGRAGEDGFAAAAEVACGWTLERIADEARACDFKMDYNGCCIRFEIKNHESSVPGEDIKKFRRDLEEHRNDTGIGVFVALNAHLGGFMRGKFIHQEWKDDTGQLLIYISAFNELDGDFVFLLLRQVFDAFLKYRAIRDTDEDSIGIDGADGLRARIDSAMIHAQTMNRHLRDLALKVARDKKTVMKMYDDSLEILKSCSTEYSLMIGLLLGEAVETSVPTIDVPSMEDSQIVVVESVAAVAAPVAGIKKKRSSPAKKTNSIIVPSDN
jgi:hypothetical protein